MKNTIFILFILISSVTISQTTISKEIGDFKTIKIYNGINVELIRSDEQKVVISGKKAEKVKVKNANGTLKISLRFPDLSADGKVDIKLYYNKDIDVIDGNEGSTITGKDIDQLN